MKVMKVWQAPFILPWRWNRDICFNIRSTGVPQLVGRVEPTWASLLLRHHSLTFAQPVVNFSQKACHDRFEALENGTAKPTPESIPDPDGKVMSRIQSRREKEEKIKEDAEQRAADTRREDNIDGNAWTSKMRQYY